MTETVETSGKYRVRLVVQEDGENANPRTEQDCNLANVITPAGQRYIDVDKDGGPLQDGWDRVSGRDDAVDVFTRWAKIFHGAVVIEDRPHDGAWSIWYMTAENQAQIVTPAEEAVRLEIEEYRLWAEGEVYGYVIEKDVTRIPRDAEDRDDPDVDDETREWEDVESCWGYIGRDYATTMAREAFVPYAKESGK